MEDALRSNLTQALSSKFDNILLNDSTAGLLGGGLTAPNDPSSVVDWPGYKGLLTDQVDGHYASMPDQVRMLIGSKTYTCLAIELHTSGHIAHRSPREGSGGPPRGLPRSDLISCLPPSRSGFRALTARAAVGWIALESSAWRRSR